MNTPPVGYPELMVDIETLGQAPSGAVLAVAAVPFCIHENKTELAPEAEWFSVRITTKSNVSESRAIEADTVEWWLEQHPNAQKALLREPRIDLDEFRAQFKAYVEKHRCEHLWAKPPAFDNVILADVYSNVYEKFPFDRRADRDLRTILDVAKRMNWADVLELEMKGEKHDALFDAAYQAAQVVTFMRRIRSCATGR